MALIKFTITLAWALVSMLQVQAVIPPVEYSLVLFPKKGFKGAFEIKIEGSAFYSALAPGICRKLSDNNVVNFPEYQQFFHGAYLRVECPKIVDDVATNFDCQSIMSKAAVRFYTEPDASGDRLTLSRKTVPAEACFDEVVENTLGTATYAVCTLYLPEFPDFMVGHVGSAVFCIQGGDPNSVDKQVTDVKRHKKGKVFIDLTEGQKTRLTANEYVQTHFAINFNQQV